MNCGDLSQRIALDGADKVREKIESAIEALASFPHRGHRRTDLTSRPLRFWPVYDYLIAYAPDECPLWVVAVMHGQRSPRHGRHSSQQRTKR